MTHRYDRIGVGYAATRRADPRVARRIADALGASTTIVNVGAGAGSYEPADRRLVAVEPSRAMIRQRAHDAAPAVQAAAEAQPFANASFDAALAVLTIHHWTDVSRGLAEMRRVARDRVVIFTWDEDAWESFWLVRDYLPCIRELDRRRAVSLATIRSALGPVESFAVPVPHDCLDGFHGAFWRRPEAYLDPRVRAGISTYAEMTPTDRDEGLGRLASDIESGAWAERNSALRDLEELDVGYRLVVARGLEERR